MEIMNKGHFLTIVAENAVVRDYGACKTWPPNNFWALVSTVKSSITDQQVPKLMKMYKVESLSDFHHGVVK
jgi:hypothetical protein